MTGMAKGQSWGQVRPHDSTTGSTESRRIRAGSIVARPPDGPRSWPERNDEAEAGSDFAWGGGGLKGWAVHDLAMKWFSDEVVQR